MTDSISLNAAESKNVKNKVEKNQSSELAGFAAAATVGAGAGLASAVVGSGIVELLNEDVVEETAEVTGQEVVDVPEQPVAPVQPITPTQPAAPVQPVTPTQPVTPVQPQEPVQQLEQPVNTGGEQEVTVQLVGEETPVIAEEQIDVNDIDHPDIINYDAVETIYTPAGEAINVAHVHDDQGFELLLVDVNDDKVYDLLTDTTFTPLAEAPAGLTVADAEIGLTEDVKYVAYNPEEHTEEFGLDTLNDDLIC